MDGGATSSFTRSPEIGGVGYGIGVSIGILSIISTIVLASYFCTRGNQPRPTSVSTNTNSASSRTNTVIEMGLDEATIKSYPKIPYPHLLAMKALNEFQCSTAASACSICLADYNQSDVVRVLPDCKHLFHLKCVDSWLRLHPTCPICRMTLIPTPLSEDIPPAPGDRDRISNVV